jgi:putative polyhydroxyalkanoate system protein
MSTISREVSHTLGLAASKEKVGQIVADIQSSNPSLISKIDWNADKTKANIKGTGFEGVFEATETKMTINIKLGLLARAFQGKIEGKVDEKIKQYFG